MENAHTFSPSGPKPLLGSQAGLGRSGVESTWVVVIAAPQDRDPVLRELGYNAGWAGELPQRLEPGDSGRRFLLWPAGFYGGLRGSTWRLCQASFGHAAHSK